MSAIWPGDERYAIAMELAKLEYQAWSKNNKTDFDITKKMEMEEDDTNGTREYSPEMDGWTYDEFIPEEY